MEPLRVIWCGALPADLNMAIDETLLIAGGSPVLRLYAWSPAAVSLGRFQDPAAFAGCELTVVRRITGGGAIHHDREITFALTADARHLPGSLPDSYDLVHGAFARALSAVGIATERPRADFAARPRPAADWCFARPACFDLVTPSGRKLLGSAQRRIRRPLARVLHHGSLPLRTPRLTPACGAIEELCDPDRIEGALRGHIAAELGRALRLAPVEDTLSAAERQRAGEIAAARYPDIRRAGACERAFRRRRPPTEVHRGAPDNACSRSPTNSKTSSTAPSRFRRSPRC